jgi:hypothetical protein
MSTIVGLQYSVMYSASDFTLIKLVLKSLKLITDISIHILFIMVFAFFVRYKQNIQVSGDLDGQRNLTKKNKVLIVWIFFLFTLTLINAMLVFMQGILTYVDPSLFDDGTILD